MNHLFTNQFMSKSKITCNNIFKSTSSLLIFLAGFWEKVNNEKEKAKKEADHGSYMSNSNRLFISSHQCHFFIVAQSRINWKIINPKCLLSAFSFQHQFPTTPTSYHFFFLLPFCNFSSHYNSTNKLNYIKIEENKKIL